MSALDQYMDAISIYRSEKGTIPNPAPGTSAIYCLGNYPAQPPFAANACIYNEAGGQLYSNSTLNSQFASIMDTLPDTSDIVVAITATEKVRGITYRIDANNVSGYIIYYVAGANQKCGRGQAQTFGDVTECRINLSQL